MPYSLVHDGVVREFDFYAPIGWQHWVGQRWLEEGKVGLPLLVALHGGAEDPVIFQSQWFFPKVWAEVLPIPPQVPDQTYKRQLVNQFFVLYPYGMARMPKGALSLAYLNLPSADTTPARGWNPGMVGPGRTIDDVGFIKAARDAMNEILKAELAEAAHDIPNDFPWEYDFPSPGEAVKVAPDVFDPDARYLFGYSEGAMLAHRLVTEMGGKWAAVWAMSGSCGGVPQFGLRETPVVNLPVDGAHAVSAFLHHGARDTTVPPGDVEAADNDTQPPLPPSQSFTVFAVGGFSNTLDYRPGFLPLSQARRGYVDYNHLTGRSIRRRAPGLRGPTGSSVLTVPDATPDPPGGWDNVGELLAKLEKFETVVVEYRDMDMEHTGFVGEGQYLGVSDVWKFFADHPRVRR